MTTTTAALVLAWIAIILLTLATAGLLRRVDQLSSRTRLQAAEPGDPVRGLQLPMSKYLSGFEGGGTAVLLLFVSPSCATCQTAIDAIASAEPLGHRIGLVTREGDPEPLQVPQEWIRLTSAHGLFQILRVPATPYVVRLGPDGTIIDATMAVGSLNVGQWLAHPSPVAGVA